MLLKLGSISQVLAGLEEVSDDDDALIRLHEILFASAGTRSSRKRSVGSWRPGSTESVAKRDSISRSLSESLGSVLKEICVILGIEIPASREEIVNDIMNFLITPRRGSPIPQIVHAIDGLDMPRKRGRKPGSKNQPRPLTTAESVSKGKPGRKKGGKNKPDYQAEYLAGTRRRPGRPKKFNEDRAFLQFVYREFPGVIRSWTKLSSDEKLVYSEMGDAYMAGVDIEEDLQQPNSQEEEDGTDTEMTSLPPQVTDDTADVLPPDFADIATETPAPSISSPVKRGRGRPPKKTRGRPRKSIV